MFLNKDQNNLMKEMKFPFMDLMEKQVDLYLKSGHLLLDYFEKTFSLFTNNLFETSNELRRSQEHMSALMNNGKNESKEKNAASFNTQHSMPNSKTSGANAKKTNK
ncbi:MULTISPECIES: hypothetical protein [Legionella]|uniref:Phasin family protein n=1 Tax=Legionella septentrionalis TaxID=2498109 RepID=A0A3S0WR70_9GAMM|nr:MULTISPECIES: hypothetical protein [Legionella]MCP0913237.1 hypothetical protein [Legionella sp. 27cVA30]RUQ84977.1 hypothetical protein EKM59_07915 [Legionella septentrionalis]